MLTALASRQLNDGVGGVPKNMAMLLVRQEIMGNELSAVETVLKSDVKREGVKRWIQYIEQELNKLDNPQAVDESVEQDATEVETQQPPPSKGKQKLKDRKKSKAASAAAAKKAAASKKKTTTVPKEEDADEKRKRLNTKLAAAYERLARIEQDEGGDPEPRARKVER